MKIWRSILATDILFLQIILLCFTNLQAGCLYLSLISFNTIKPFLSITVSAQFKARSCSRT